MTLEMAASPAPTRKQLTKPLALAAVGAALVLLTAAGVAAWRVDRHGGTGRASTRASTALLQPAARRGADRAPTYYLVGSHAQADVVQAGITEADVLRAQQGETPQPVEVVVVESERAVAAVSSVVAELNAIRAGFGLPSARVVDLRSQETASEPMPGG